MTCYEGRGSLLSLVSFVFQTCVYALVGMEIVREASARGGGGREIVCAYARLDSLVDVVVV